MYKFVLCTLFFTLNVIAADQSNFVIPRPDTITVNYVEEFHFLKNGETYAGKKQTDTLTLTIRESRTMQEIEDKIKELYKVEGTLYFEPIHITQAPKNLSIHDYQKQCLQAMMNKWRYTFVADKTDEVRTCNNDNQ